MHSSWHQQKMVHVKDVLVVILGIGDYDGNMANLIGIPKDYKNLIATFYKVFGYSILFFDDKNQLHYCNKKANHNNNCGNNGIAKQTKLKSDKFKIKWSSEEIDDFVDKSRQILINTNTKGQLIHDSLLFFVSCHGDMDNVILDSDCEPVSLLSIFNQFCGEKCPQMLDKPKLFFIDACRGSMKSRIKINTNVTPSEKTCIKVNAPNQQSNMEIELDLYENIHTVNVGTDSITVPPTARSMESNIAAKCDHETPQLEKVLKNVDHGTFRGVQNHNVDEKQSTDAKINIDSNKLRCVTPLQQLFHTEANCRIIYANPEGYAAVDAGSKGGYLIQAVKHVFNKTSAIENENLDSIVNQIRFKTRQLVGNGMMENVEDVNRMNFSVYFNIV